MYKTWVTLLNKITGTWWYFNIIKYGTKDFCLQKQIYFLKNWIISGILYIKDWYDKNGYFKPFEHFAKKKQPKINIILSGCWNIKSFSPLLNEFIHTFSNPSYVNTRIVLNSNFLLAYSNVLGKSKNLYENLFEKKNCKQCPRSKQ